MEADKYAKKCNHSRSADAWWISKAARQERQNHVKQVFFSNAQCVTHLGVVSLTYMFQTSSVQLILIFSVLQREAALLAPPFQHLRRCFIHAIESNPSSMAVKPPPTALMDASASHASHPLETHGVEEVALEATKEHIFKMGKWRQAAAQAVQDHHEPHAPPPRRLRYAF